MFWQFVKKDGFDEVDLMNACVVACWDLKVFEFHDLARPVGFPESLQDREYDNDNE
jgi:hypothetical protein